ncbi:MAG: TIGR03619 family F420-dependent LLM class oxidoreductase [Anaerolineaceae bacterium]|nr:TIGR03619 family F420-dependent LLM class oxidoreductase [Anaerolineaceae bacterium]
MKLGVIFPQTEIGADPAVIREYVQTVEGLGYDYLTVYDHVLGANPDRPGGWSGPYTYLTQFHEPMVLFGWMAALTQHLEFVTGVIILPQRQTALVAKQAAELSVLSGGRFRLGVGVGWNTVEYEGLNEDFHTRGKRLEEQIPLLRELWAKPLVTFKGEFDKIPDAGLNPLPARPIPIWFGGDADVALRRSARLGDGWLPNTMPVSELRLRLKTLRSYLVEAGRDPQGFGVDFRISANRTPQSEWANDAAQLAEMGVSHVAINTMGMGYKNLQEHLEAVKAFKTILTNG